MKIFMLGWEFPPHISGGLGTACHGLTKALSEVGAEVSFVLPSSVPVSAQDITNVSLKTFADVTSLPETKKTVSSTEVLEEIKNVTLRKIPANLMPYANPENYEESLKVLRKYLKTHRHEVDDVLGHNHEVKSMIEKLDDSEGHYSGDLMSQVRKYATMSVRLGMAEQFDVIHAHDWMTFPAGIELAKKTGKPLVVHVHSTEFDRSGNNGNRQIHDIEYQGMAAADKVVCVSYLTRSIAMERYKIPAEKISVVYNAVEFNNQNSIRTKPIQTNEKIVLFLGRLTMQKGPDYFIEAARKVVDHFKKVRFVIAGSGDMVTKCIARSAELGLSSHVTFTGFLQGEDVEKIFQMADLYVMPSVSEPFGIAPLEAISHNVPVIISKQSGVSEVLTHVLKVDFWNIDEMADKILAVLRHPPLQKTLKQHGQIEVKKLSWVDSAKRMLEIYKDLVSNQA